MGVERGSLSLSRHGLAGSGRGFDGVGQRLERPDLVEDRNTRNAPSLGFMATCVSHGGTLWRTRLSLLRPSPCHVSLIVWRSDVSRRTLRNVAIIIAVVFVVRTIVALVVDTPTGINFVIGAVAGAVALVIIDLVDRKQGTQL